MTSPISAANEEQRFDGQVASAGFAFGRIFQFSEAVSPGGPAPRGVGDELSRFANALATAVTELTRLMETLSDDDASALVEFQIAMLEDETVTEPIRASIKDGCDAITAWRRGLDTMVADYQAADDAYFRGRASDLVDMRDRVMHGLAGVAVQKIPRGCILLADDLSPTRFLETEWGGGGIALAAGSSSSHVAMLARAQAVPMIVGLHSSRPQLGRDALLDGESGTLIVAPTPQSRAGFRERQAAAARTAEAEANFRDRPAVTAAGERVAVYLNIAGPDDLVGIDPRHCDGIGLVRTELMLSGAALRDEDAQFSQYKRILEWAGGLPVTIRTLDAGGDKPIPGVTIDGEGNPFLGVRGFRLSLLREDIFRIQLRALLRASSVGPLRIMLPMISVPEEMTAARRLLNEARNELAAEGAAIGDCSLGMMVEVPAAAIAIDHFDADFYSIGSNDLVQYVMAAGRDNARLSALAGGLPKAVEQLLSGIAQHAAKIGREASICGDLAGDPKYVGPILDCGLRTLSVASSALARTKAAVARHGMPNG